MLAVAVTRLPDDSVYSPSGVVHAVVPAGSGVGDWVYQETIPGGGREVILVEGTRRRVCERSMVVVNATVLE